MYFRKSIPQKEIKYGLYKRKSTDDERQVLSLGSQKSDALKRFSNLKIVELDDESVSAFRPYKRPVFNEMIEKIKKGEIQGIVAWHPDRLSRNPIDAAQIIYLLDIGALKDLKFSSYHFDNSPEGKMMLQIVMSQSKYSSDKLSKDVKRGMDNKAETGWRPGRAPLGYLNSKREEKGKQYICNDPERFHLVEQLLQTMLTGNYTGPKLLEYANEELGLRLIATKTLPSRKLRHSELYRILTNPFYYGWYEWVKGSDNWIQGKHEPMISEEEFDKIQFLLGRDGRPRPKKHKFAFTGIMKCSCGASITAEEKFKHQKNGNTHHYIYYHCTRRVNPNCTEKSIELKEFNRQIDKLIEGLTISERFQKWALSYLHEIRKQEAKAQENTLEAKQKRLMQVVKQLDDVMIKYTAPENYDGLLISDNELLIIKSRLLKEKASLENELSQQGKKIEEWVELTEKTFNFARYAQTWFAKGDLDQKRAVFACLGSHFLIKDQKVAINMRKPFNFIFEGLPKAKEELRRLEPIENYAIAERIKHFVQQFPTLSGIRESNSCLNLGRVPYCHYTNSATMLVDQVVKVQDTIRKANC